MRRKFNEGDRIANVINGAFADRDQCIGDLVIAYLREKHLAPKNPTTGDDLMELLNFASATEHAIARVVAFDQMYHGACADLRRYENVRS